MIRHAALTSTDALFGFQKIVRAAWFFPGAIDAEMLRGALDEFGDAHPIFRGRVCRRAPPSRNVNLNLLQMCAPPRPPFSDYSVRGRPSEEARIPLFVHELDGVDPGNGYADVREEDVLRGSGNTTYLPDDIMRGVAPCMKLGQPKSPRRGVKPWSGSSPAKRRLPTRKKTRHPCLAGKFRGPSPRIKGRNVVTRMAARV